MPNRRNAERAECRILTVVIKQTKSYISLLLSLCGASVYSQYYKIRLDILCKSRKFDSRPYCRYCDEGRQPTKNNVVILRRTIGLQN